VIASPAILPSDSVPAPPRAHPDPLSALLSSSLPISDLAASLNLSIPDFLTLYQSPDFQTQLAAIDDLTQARLRIHSAQARLTAIQALESLTRSAQDPVERRRAAASLMRATSAATQRSHDNDADGDSDSSRAPHRPRPRQLPSRRLRAEQVAALIARALADNDSPTPDSGLATLHAFLSPDTRAASPHLPDFINAAHDQIEDQVEDQVEDQADDAPSPSAQSPVPGASPDLPLPDLEALTDLLDAPNAPTCSAPAQQHGRTATVDLHWPLIAPSRLPTAYSPLPTAHSPLPTAHSPLPTAYSPLPTAYSPLPTAPLIRFHLTRPDTGPLRMCWLIDRITRVAPATGPPV
jgi:hypothetical protein